MSRLLQTAAVWVLFSWACLAEAPLIKLDVDARELGRKLIHAKLEIPAAPGEFSLWFPKWIPGTHSPVGPVQKLAGLHFKTPSGQNIEWRRHSDEPWRFVLQNPPGTATVIAEMDCVADGGTFPEAGVAGYGSSLIGIIPWNAVLLYPDGVSTDIAQCRVTLQLPAEWQFGTALKVAQQSPTNIEFKPDTIAQVVDCPLICGKNFRTFDLKGKDTPPVYLHITSESPSATALDDQLIAGYRNLVTEALALFGGAHFDEYHFLVVCSDSITGIGLEHLTSSLNATGERSLADEVERKKGHSLGLLPHEFVHSWCGKYRRPLTMCTTNLHQPLETPLLWVYEGLTTHLGDLLAVRSGLVSTNDHIVNLAIQLERLNAIAGRQWRSLEDTATATWITWGAGSTWPELRRGADYYGEGLTTWLEIDSILRKSSNGKASLDDFCRKFLGPDPAHPGPISPYELKDVVATLNSVAPYDWAKFLHDRISEPRTKLDLEFLNDLGWRLQYAPKPSEHRAEVEPTTKGAALFSSIGLAVDTAGRIGTVVPGLPGDKAGLAPGMTIAGVNDRKFSSQRLKDAVADSVARHEVNLLLLDGEVFRNVKIEYADGPRYLELIRNPDQPDEMAKIFAPRTAH